MCFFRIGEAKVPGPLLKLGAMNPTGLAGKGAQCSSLEHGVFAVSETHLTAVGCTRFATELRCNQSQFKFCPGAPAPPKSNSLMSTGGRHTGVGFLTTSSARLIRNGWQSEHFRTGRCAAAQFHHAGSWITGGVVYGWAASSESNAVKHQTNDLVSHVFDQLRFHHGPKFIAGDWNQHYGSLPIHDVLIQHGWIEVQTFAQNQWGVSPSMTCKGASRKDFIYVSPEMKGWIQEVSIETGLFPDHAILSVVLDIPGKPEEFPYWFKPRPLQYSSALKDALQEMQVVQPQVHEGNPTTVYRAILEEHERCVDNLSRSIHQQGCMSHQVGRGSVLHRSYKKSQVAPIKPARHGEPSPTFVGRSMQLKQWYAQWRRLINLDRACRSVTNSPHLPQHKVALWRAIREAPGFAGSFASWWSTRSVVHPHSPVFIPQHLPDPASVTSILHNFAAEVRRLDQHLHKTWVARTKSKFAANPNAVFQAVRDPGPVPVEILLEQKQRTVVEVVDEGSVTVDSSDSLETNLPLFCNGLAHQAEIISEDQIWFQSEHDLTPGMTLTQQHPIGSLADIFAAFETEWSKRWDKHRQVQDDRWDSTIQFIDQHIPSGEMVVSPITLNQWDTAVRHKPSRSAIGMDGVHRDDLINMPLHLKKQLVDLIDRVELNGQWPDQLLHGGVFSLEKRPGATQVHEFRPITVLPTVYRIWSTIRSRELISFLSTFAPTHLFGNVKGRSSVNMWWAAQALAEQNMYDEQVAVGVIADLQKAFNTLPRLPLFHLAIRLGVPNRILRPWLHMLTGLERHFFVRNACGPGVKSCTGFAEGCGLSVAAMMMCNILVHSKMALLHPSVHMWSYVDNWELYGKEVDDIVQALNSLEQTCIELDLALDRAKTCTWALDGVSRQSLRNEGLTVQRNLRDLGGHQQFSRQQTNGTLKAQCERLHRLWPALARSHAPYLHKLRVIRCKAWPRGLHAASGVHISPSIFKSLRANACKGLRADKAGANSQILLSLVHFPSHDPACYAIIDAVIQFRRFADPLSVEPYLAQASQLPDSRRVPGPCGVLISRLEVFGWTHLQGTQFADQDQMPVDVLHTSLKDVKTRIYRAWQQHVGSLCAKRHGFEGLQCVDAGVTTRHVAQLDYELQAPIRSLLVGVFITADQQGEMFHVDQADRVCKFCLAPDSLHHRHWECSHTQESRRAIPSEHMIIIKQQPACFQERGWCVEPVSVQEFRESLHLIEDSSGIFHIPQHLPLEFDCFTDGAACDPSQPSTCLASWGWVLGDIQSDNFWPIAEGGIPDQWQTVVRAEIYAVLSVVRFVAAYPRRTRIWCDNQLVVDRLQLALDGQIAPNFLLHDHDLWSRLQVYLHDISKLISVHKVVSHQDPQHLSDAEAWIVAGNNAADQVANQAFAVIPNVVRQAWSNASKQCNALYAAHKSLIQHMSRVAQLSIQFGKVRLADDAPTQHHQPPPVSFREVVDAARPKLTRSFHFDGCDRILHWLTCIEEVDSPIRQVCFPELLIAFQLATGLVGIENVYTTKHNHRQWQLRNRWVEYAFNEVTRSFSSFCCSLIKMHSPGWKVTQGRPSSYRFQYWTGIVGVAISPVIAGQVESWLMTHCGMTPFRKASDLAMLPFASGPPC